MLTVVGCANANAADVGEEASHRLRIVRGRPRCVIGHFTGEPSGHAADLNTG